MKRRSLLLAATAATLGAAGAARAQVTDLGDAINKAGRQRMLSQRMAKAWLALVHKTEASNAQLALDRSMSLFDRQLVELKAYAPNGEVRETYTRLEAAWSEYKGALVGAAPSRASAATVLAADARVLSLANQGTQQYELVLARPVGRLVNMAGRQRMLSQRMAKFYFAAALPVDPAVAIAEIGKARTEFLTAMDVLRNAPEATTRIKDELTLADTQWLFFDQALQKVQTASAGRSLSDVFVTSENLLQVMDRVTGLYSAMRT